MQINGRSQRGGSILFFNEAGGRFGKRTEIEAHEGLVLIGVRSPGSIPTEFPPELVVVRGSRQPWERI